MAYNSEVGAWGGMANPGAKAQTFDEFMATLRARPGLLGADGRMQGIAGGGPWDSQGKTPDEFFKEKMATKIQSGFNGYGDDMAANMVDPSHVSLDPTQDTRSQGLKVGLMMLSAPFAAAAMGLGAGGAAGGAGGAGAGFSGIGSGAAGSAGIGSGTAFGGAAAAGDIAALSGSQIAALSPAATAGGFSFATPEIMTAGTGLDLGAIGTTAIPGESAMGAASLLGNESAAETARLASMNAGTNTLGGISPGSAIGDSSMFDTAGQWLKDNPTLAKLGGSLLGAAGGAAASGDKTTSNSSNRDPWAPAQPYLLDNLKTNANAQEFYRANPFSDLQKQQYQNYFNALGNAQANIPGLLANASNFGKSNRGQMPAMQGLLSGTQAAPIDFSQYANIGRRG